MMKILEKTDYYKLTGLLKEVNYNNLFARSVIEHKVTGKVFVDNPENPKTCWAKPIMKNSIAVSGTMP